MKRFEEVEHSADWAFRAFGRDLRELLQNAADAMLSLQGREAGKPVGNYQTPETVELDALDRETLLVDWLNEILYRQETGHKRYDRVEVLAATDTQLEARLFGCQRGKPNKLIKAATFHDLRIRRTDAGWEATVVVDV